MQQIIYSTGIGLVTLMSVVGIVVKNRNEKKKLKRQPRFNEQVRPQKTQEIFASFRHRDEFRVDRLANDHRLSKASSTEKFAYFIPIKAQDLIDKYSREKDNSQQIEFKEEDFRCPLSQELFLNDPVVLNGHVYERDAVEDWIFQSDWLDPLNLIQKLDDSLEDVKAANEEGVLQENQVSPEDIQECSEELMRIIQRFKDQQSSRNTQVNLKQPKIQVESEDNDLKFQPIQYDSDDESEKYFEQYFYKESDGQSFVTSTNLNSAIRNEYSPLPNFNEETKQNNNSKISHVRKRQQTD